MDQITGHQHTEDVCIGEKCLMYETWYVNVRTLLESWKIINQGPENKVYVCCNARVIYMTKQMLVNLQKMHI